MTPMTCAQIAHDVHKLLQGGLPYDAAVDKVAERIRKHPDSIVGLADWIVRQAEQEAYSRGVRPVVGHESCDIQIAAAPTGPTPHSTPSPRPSARSLLNLNPMDQLYPIPGSDRKRLGDFTRSDVGAVRDYYSANRKSYAAKERAWSRLYDAMKPDDTLGSVGARLDPTILPVITGKKDWDA